MKSDYMAGRIMAAFPQPSPEVADYISAVQALDLAAAGYGDFADAFADMAVAWNALRSAEQVVIGSLDKEQSYTIRNRAVKTERRIGGWVAYLVDAPGCYAAGASEVEALTRMTALLADREEVVNACATT